MKPQALGVLQMQESKEAEYSAEIIRYLKWRYGGEGAFEIRLHERYFEELPRN